MVLACPNISLMNDVMALEPSDDQFIKVVAEKVDIRVPATTVVKS